MGELKWLKKIIYIWHIAFKILTVIKINKLSLIAYIYYLFKENAFEFNSKTPTNIWIIGRIF